MDIMACSNAIRGTTVVGISHQVSHRAAQRFQLLSTSPEDLHLGYCFTKMCHPNKTDIGGTWMHRHKWWCLLIPIKMLWQSLRALCLAPRGLGASGSIQKYNFGSVECLGGWKGASGPILISLITCGNMTSWLHLWGCMESWLVDVNLKEVKLYAVPEFSGPHVIRRIIRDS
jgi:hypothetical protein